MGMAARWFLISLAVFFLSVGMAAAAVKKVNIDSISIPSSGMMRDDEDDLIVSGIRKAIREFMEDNCIDPDNPRAQRFFRKTSTYAKRASARKVRRKGESVVGNVVVYLKTDLLAKDFKKKGLGRWTKSCSGPSGLAAKQIFVLQERWDDTSAASRAPKRMYNDGSPATPDGTFLNMAHLLFASKVNFSMIQDSLRDQIIQRLVAGGFNVNLFHQNPEYWQYKLADDDPLLGYYWDEFSKVGNAVNENMKMNQKLLKRLYNEGGIILYFKVGSLRMIDGDIIAKVAFNTFNTANQNSQASPSSAEFRVSVEKNTSDGRGQAIEAAIRGAAAVALRRYPEYLREYLEGLSN